MDFYLGFEYASLKCLKTIQSIIDPGPRMQWLMNTFESKFGKKLDGFFKSSEYSLSTQDLIAVYLLEQEIEDSLSVKFNAFPFHDSYDVLDEALLRFGKDSECFVQIFNVLIAHFPHSEKTLRSAYVLS